MNWKAPLNPQLKPSQKVGILFEQAMYEDFILRDLALETTDGTDYKHFADLIEKSTNNLIEIKSHRSLKSESTLQSFEKVIKGGIDRATENKNKKLGLLHQLIQMSKHSSCSLTILGIYSNYVEDVVQMLEVKHSKASEQFFAYKILINNNNVITYQVMEHKSFWDKVSESNNIPELVSKIEKTINPGSSNTVIFGQCDGLIEFLKCLKFGLTADEIEEYYTSIITQNNKAETWITIEQEQGQKQIQFKSTETKNQLVELPFSEEQLSLIKSSIENEDSFEDISSKLGKSPPYLYGCLKPENNKGLHWDNLRNWIKPILIQSEHLQTPFEWASGSLKEKLYNHAYSRLRGQLALNGKLKSQIEQIKQEKNIMNEQEDKGLSQLQKETYQAEIEKHKMTNEELKASIERSVTRALETEIVNLKHEREELEEELEEQKSMTESLRNNIHNAYQKDLERYRKVIDMLLDQLDKQESE